jgi:hypothetical protein
MANWIGDEAYDAWRPERRGFDWFSFIVIVLAFAVLALIGLANS